jgi:hypothetical protein
MSNHKFFLIAINSFLLVLIGAFFKPNIFSNLFAVAFNSFADHDGLLDNLVTATVPMIGEDLVIDTNKRKFTLKTSVLLAQSGSLEQDILAEINRVRSNPSAYAEELVKITRYFDGKILKIPGEIPMMTTEGVSAVNEAIQDLRSQNSAPPLKWSDAISQAARDHVNDTGGKGIVSHDGTDGSNPFSRMERYGTFQGTAAENVSYGSHTAKDVVKQLIIDDGVPSRGHRKTIVNADLRIAGVACGHHSQYKTMCVIDYAANFIDKNSHSPVQNLPPQTDIQNTPNPINQPEEKPIQNQPSHAPNTLW